MLTLSFFPTLHYTHTHTHTHTHTQRFCPSWSRVVLLSSIFLLLSRCTLHPSLPCSCPRRLIFMDPINKPLCPRLLIEFVQCWVPERGQGRKQGGGGTGRGKGEVRNSNILLLPAVSLNPKSLLLSRWPLLNDNLFWLLMATPSTCLTAARGGISSTITTTPGSCSVPWDFLYILSTHLFFFFFFFNFF